MRRDNLQMITLVTGATGFIGTHLVKALVGKGRDVRCLVRKTSNTKEIEKLGVELFYGDLLDKQSLEKAVKGVNIIHHVAGEVYSYKVKEYLKNNVDGTKNLLEACYDKNIIKFIYLSSIAAVGQNQSKDVLLNEESLCNPTTSYGKSKREAEKMLLKAFDIHRLPIVIIRPPIVYGPRQPPALTRIFRMIHQGKFKIIGDGTSIKSFCYIDNLIKGVLLAEESGKTVGRIFFISDSEPYTPKKMAQTIAIEERVVLSRRHLPSFVSSLCGYLVMGLEKFFGIYSISLYAIRTMNVDFACDISLAKKELGYNPNISLQEGIRETVKWCREEGILRN
jgi:nucleoside-diphosphate-sugar epimerase